MFFKQFYDDDLAQGSYLIGCQAAGEAVVVDARRDIDVYRAEAERQGLKITAVTETHIHADYLSGSRELAAATGADLYLSAEGGADWQYRFDGKPLRHGSEIRVGNISLRAVHTPGHTPEHLSFLVTDHMTAEDPMLLLTGDFVFVGDLGRPDLLDEAAGGEDTRFASAIQVFESLRDRFVLLPDYVQIWPGHGAGSACGRALGSVASSTVGYEKRFAWWAEFVQRNDQQGFTAELLSGQPDTPRYFGRMKEQNRAGPDLLGTRSSLRPFKAAEVTAGHVLVDTRTAAVFNQDGVVDSLHIPGGRKFATYASYVLDPEKSQALVLLADDEQQALEFRDRLAYIGFDDVAGYITTLDDFKQRGVPLVSPAELDEMQDAQLLDVRGAAEHATGSISGAQHLHAGSVMWHLDEIEAGKPVVVYCQSGARATLAASALRLAGFDARELAGNYPAWQEHQASKGK